MFNLIQRIPNSIKLISYVLGILFCVFYLCSSFLNIIVNHINLTYQLHIPMQEIFVLLKENMFGNILLTGLVIMAIMSIIIWIDSSFFIRKINNSIRYSLEKRHLKDNFSQFYSAKSFLKVAKNIERVFVLYRSFDNLKVSRIVLEVATTKQLMNNIKDGVMFINRELVVTHINHIAEQKLGFISGEVLGQTLSRKMDNEILLDSLDKVFDINHKFLDLDIKEENTFVSIYPIKDKFGEVIRALVLIK